MAAATDLGLTAVGGRVSDGVPTAADLQTAVGVDITIEPRRAAADAEGVVAPPAAVVTASEDGVRRDGDAECVAGDAGSLLAGPAQAVASASRSMPSPFMASATGRYLLDAIWCAVISPRDGAIAQSRRTL